MRGNLVRIALAGASVFVIASAASAAVECSTYPSDQADAVAYNDLTAKLGPVPKPEGKLHIVYIAKTLLNEALQAISQGVKDEADAQGVESEIQAVKDESSPVDQLNLAQAVLARKPDAILMSPESDTNLRPTLKAAKAANIPTVVIIDARTDGAGTYVGADQIDVGRQGAEYLHKIHPDGGEVAQIEGQAGSPNARRRIQGFKEGIAKYPNLKLVASQPGNWDRLTALDATTNILRAHPDLIGIYANNDTMALGAVEAVKTAGKLKQVAVVGTDGIRAARHSIANGELVATVADDLYGEGKISLDMALRLLKCEPLPKWVVTDKAVITKDNVKDFPDPPLYKP
jgi:ribose transport system substrate-binding protein